MFTEKVERISPVHNHCFFGYYDVPAYSDEYKKHLCHRVSFIDRLPRKSEKAEIGYLYDEDFFPVAETGLWNFQQGAMLQWDCSSLGERIFYNDLRDGNGVTVLKNIKTGEERVYGRPSATISPDGRYGISVNFARIYDFRPGYGYIALDDPNAAINAPGDDGVFLMDFLHNRESLILSYEEIKDFMKLEADRKLVINHINISSDGKSFVMLVRYFPKLDRSGDWVTAMLVCGIDGNNLGMLLNFSYASHYHWKNGNELLVHSQGADGVQLYEYDCRTKKGTVVDKGFFVKDGHCSYSPDRSWILYDSYPDSDNKRWIYLYSIKAGKGIPVGSFFSMPVDIIDIRCDLHPRWMPDGRHITFDSTHEGFRGVYRLELSEAMNKIELA